MKAAFFARRRWVWILAYVLVPAAARGQARPPVQEAVAPAPEASEAALVQGAQPGETLRILYTGKLLGYFRTPDQQSMDPTSPCGKRLRPSRPASEFDTVIKTLTEKANASTPVPTVLLGTGDNFAPEIEARTFCDSPKSFGPSRAPKDLFCYDFVSNPTEPKWISGSELAKQRLDDPTTLRSRLAHGDGILPADNVAQFFVNEGYAALVPGKHDFEFGPERLRLLARYLATTPIPKANNRLHGESVQMLAANLVIKTEWKTDHKPLPDTKLHPWFTPRFPTAAEMTGQAKIDLQFSGLSDGATVYPWFRGLTLNLSEKEVPQEILDKVEKSQFLLCPAKDGDPNGISRDCTTLTPKRVTDEKLHYRLDFPWRDRGQLATLEPDQNYGFCVRVQRDIPAKDEHQGPVFCVRFSTYTPFFQYPWGHTGSKCQQPKQDKCYRNPEPYVLLEKAKHGSLPTDAVIFGVVAPGLGEHVGMLNLSWWNGSRGSDLKTQTAVTEPDEALRQMLAAFERKYKEENKSQFGGIRVLLAQMSPEAAQVLATRLGSFQVVISAADADRATVDDVSTTNWVKPPHQDARYPRILAVPEPFYVAAAKPQWNVDIGSLTLRLPKGPTGSWSLVSYHKRQPLDLGKAQIPNFWAHVEQALTRQCLAPKSPLVDLGPRSQANQIQLLTLCAMQRHSRADVALLQRRDFFPVLPADVEDIGSNLSAAPDKALQPILDRMIWKGDLLTFWYVPGSALEAVMKQSKVFDAQEKSNTSFAAEADRGLVALGITYDPENSEYIVNGLPLDANRLYSVVTSDYLGAGDTGYPGFAAAQQKRPAAPGDFDKRLETISSVLCGVLAGHNAKQDCLHPIAAAGYFDEIEMLPSDSRSGNTPGRAFRTWLGLSSHGRVPGSRPKPAESAADAAQRNVQKRPLWDFNLTKWAVGITTLAHTGSDYDVQNNFGGVTSPGVSAARATTFTSDFQAQLTRSSDHHQFFLAPGYTYNTQYKGQPDDSRQINQVADLGWLDLGYVRLWPGRGAQHYDLVATAHFETPLAKAFNAYTLTTRHTGQHGEAIKDQLRFDVNRSYTELARLGFRLSRRVSSVEVGPEFGHEWNALEHIDFVSGTAVTRCWASASSSIPQCIKDLISKQPQIFTSGTEVRTGRLGHNHSGIYWKLNLTVPFHPKVSYVLTDAGDWFWVRFHSDNSTDTLVRDYSQHLLKFSVFPSLSIGPEVDVLFYCNKSVPQLRGHCLRQHQLVMKAQFAFEWFNRRKIWRQIEYARPSAGGSK